MRKDMNEALRVLEMAVARSSVIEHTNLHRLTAELASAYVILGTHIQVNDAWTWGKLEDAADAAKRARVLCFRKNTSEKLRELLEFVAFAADIGRLVVRNFNVSDKKKRELQKVHGSYSAMFIRQMADHPQNHLWSAIELAITRHSDKESPTLAGVNGDRVALYLCQLLRDIDKLGNWVGTGALYVTPSKIVLESETNGVKDLPKADDAILRVFEAGMPIERNDCKTYVEYMLQFLAWGYDFAFEELWQEVVDSGQPQLVLAWIKKRLVVSGQERSWRRIERAAEENLGLKAA